MRLKARLRERFTIIGTLVILALVTFGVFVMLLLQGGPEPKDWCRDPWGHDQPMEYCQ